MQRHRQVADFARMFVNYSLERIQVKDLNPAFNDPAILQNNILLAESLLLGAGGRRTVSKIGPTYVYNTVNDPIFPSSGARLTGSLDIANVNVPPAATSSWVSQSRSRGEPLNETERT